MPQFSSVRVAGSIPGETAPLAEDRWKQLKMPSFSAYIAALILGDLIGNKEEGLRLMKEPAYVRDRELAALLQEPAKAAAFPPLAVLPKAARQA